MYICVRSSVIKHQVFYLSSFLSTCLVSILIPILFHVSMFNKNVLQVQQHETKQHIPIAQMLVIPCVTRL